jgi:hypothetical protein
MEIDSGAAAAANANTANKLDLPLDQLITANRQAKRRQRKPTGGAKPQQQQQRSGPYQRRASGGIQSASRQNAPKATSVPDVGSKIIVSNLHFNVTESDLRVSFPSAAARLPFLPPLPMPRCCYGHDDDYIMSLCVPYTVCCL